MKILDTIAAAFSGKKQPNSAKLAELISAAETEAAAAHSRVTELEASRAETALQGEAARLDHRAALTSARDDVVDLDGAIATLRGRHGVAVEAEAEAARKKVYDSAYAAATAVAGGLPALLEQYETGAKALRDIVRQIGEIDTKVSVANANLPAGVQPLEDSTSLRTLPGIPKEVVSEKTRELWCRPGASDPLANEWQAQVTLQPDGRGYLHRPEAHSLVYCEKRRFTVREVREAVPGVRPVSWFELNLPAVYAWQHPIFRLAHGAYRPDLVAEVDRCVAAEKSAEKSKQSDRPVKVETMLVREGISQ